MTESLVQSSTKKQKGTFKVEPYTKKWLLYCVILTGVYFVGSLISLAWGPSYFYGSLFGVISVWVSIGITFFATGYKPKSKRTTILLAMLSYFLKTFIIIGILLIPMLAINMHIFQLKGVKLLIGNVNVFATLIYHTIPFIATLFLLKK